jgi:hypothetical protein
MRTLRLRKETLTPLTDEQLGAVVGGDSVEVRSQVRTFCWSCVGMCIKP